jgi:hypothetical protein
MKNNRIKTRQNLWSKQFVPHREQHSCCDEKDHLATAVLVRGFSLHYYLQSDRVGLVEIKPVKHNELFIWKIIIIIFIIIFIIIKIFKLQYYLIQIFHKQVRYLNITACVTSSDKGKTMDNTAICGKQTLRLCSMSL